MDLKGTIRTIARRSGYEVRDADYVPQSHERKIFDYYLDGQDRNVGTIFDVGANIGQTALAFSGSFPDATIYSFEPFDRAFRALEENTRRLPHVLRFPLALGDADTTVEVASEPDDEDSDINSLLADKQKELQARGVTTFQTVTVRTGAGFCAEHGVEVIDVLKIDTEGYEIPVLDGFGETLRAGSVHCILCEFCLLQNRAHQTPLLALDARLRPDGFALASVYDLRHEADGAFHYGNALLSTPTTSNPTAAGKGPGGPGRRARYHGGMRLYIIRHADPDYPNKTITERGHQEAAALAERLARWERPDQIFCSPLGRAVDTMRYTAERMGKEAIIEDWTQEMPLPAMETPDWGRIAVWDLPGEVVRGRDPLPSRDDWHTLPHVRDTPARTQFESLQAGSDAFLARHGYVREGGLYRCLSPSDAARIAVFCHAGFGIAWLAHLLEIPLSLAWSGFWLAPSSVTTVLMERRSEDRAVPRVVSLGDVSHLYAAGLEVSPRGILAKNW